MSISQYYKERDKLLADQREERATLLAHGVSAEDIDKMHETDYEAWKANRVYAIRNRTSAEELGEEALSLLWLRRNESNDPSKIIYGFLDSIENEKLFAVLKELKPDDLAMVEACLVNGVTQEEYAVIVGKSQSAIARKLGRIKKKLISALTA